MDDVTIRIVERARVKKIGESMFGQSYPAALPMVGSAPAPAAPEFSALPFGIYFPWLKGEQRERKRREAAFFEEEDLSSGLLD